MAAAAENFRRHKSDNINTLTRDWGIKVGAGSNGWQASTFKCVKQMKDRTQDHKVAGDAWASKNGGHIHTLTLYIPYPTEWTIDKMLFRLWCHPFVNSAEKRS